MLYGSAYTTNILEFLSLMIFYEDPKLYQSTPDEKGQLMAITTCTLTWEVFYKCFLYRVQIHGASVINYQSTLVLFGTRTKHFSHKLDHIRNTVRLIAGNDASFEHRLKTLNSPTLYLRKDCLGLLQLFEIIKSGFPANLEDCMFFNKRETPVYTRVFHRKHSYGIISLYSLSDFYFFCAHLSSKLLNFI